MNYIEKFNKLKNLLEMSIKDKEVFKEKAEKLSQGLSKILELWRAYLKNKAENSFKNIGEDPAEFQFTPEMIELTEKLWDEYEDACAEYVVELQNVMLHNINVAEMVMKAQELLDQGRDEEALELHEQTPDPYTDENRPDIWW